MYKFVTKDIKSWYTNLGVQLFIETARYESTRNGNLPDGSLVERKYSWPVWTASACVYIRHTASVYCIAIIFIIVPSLFQLHKRMIQRPCSVWFCNSHNIFLSLFAYVHVRARASVAIWILVRYAYVYTYNIYYTHLEFTKWLLFNYT